MMRMKTRPYNVLLPMAAIAVAAMATSASAEERRSEITPYIEAAQVVTKELSPGSDTLTYSRLAAGVDARVIGRNTQGAVSLRYERHIGWQDNASDGDVISGIGRASVSIVPRTLTMEVGGLAARTRLEANGSGSLNPFEDTDEVSNVYSVFAGPSLSTAVGDVAVNANYRLGYSRVESPDSVLLTSGGDPVNVFDDSTTHDANVHLATRPGDVLPVGLGVGAGWHREDISNLDQRIDDKHVRADVTIPVTPTLAVVGGVGYEKVRISSRDVLFDSGGAPVIGDDGRYVTDKSAPRKIAYDVDGVIWDVGVVWRPSDRTTAEAHFGRRYGSTSFYGSFAWQASRRSSLNIAVYDNVASLGGRLFTTLEGLPSDFDALRNPLTGELNGCVGSLEDGTCVNGALGSVRATAFRGRGIMATYGLNLGRMQAGIGAGYDRRKFITAEDTILASLDGKADENIWLSAYLNGQIGPRGSFTTNLYASWFDSGLDSDGSSTAFGATAAYSHSLSDHLSASAAVGVDGIDRKILDDAWNLSGMVGMRYSF